MNAYMTSGTLDFLLKLDEKYPDHHFFYMKNQSNVTVYYESEAKSVFVSGREYEVIAQSGSLEQEGYVVMNNIPVTEEGQPLFEERFKRNEQMMATVPGFYAFRLLKPKKDLTYIVLTQWARETDFEHWKLSEKFADVHADQDTKHPAYFADEPFINHYHMINFEDEQD